MGPAGSLCLTCYLATGLITKATHRCIHLCCISICLTSAVTLLHLHLQDEFLHTRLSLQPDLSLVEQDLEFLSDVSLRFELPPIQSPYISTLFIHPGTGGEIKQPGVVVAGRPAEA